MGTEFIAQVSGAEHAEPPFRSRHGGPLLFAVALGALLLIRSQWADESQER
jgi:hypothetical protein